MIFKRFTVLLVLTLSSFAGDVLAQRKLSVDDAMYLARRNNKDLRAARERIAQAKVGVEIVRVAFRPVGSATLTYTRNSVESKLDLPTEERTIQPFDQVDAVATVTMPLIVPWAYSAERAASENAEQAKANYEAMVVDLLHNTAVTFYAAAGADELLRTRQNAVRVAQKTLDDAKVRVEVGTVNEVEAVRAEVAVVRARQMLLEAEEARRNAYLSLHTLLQVREAFVVVASPPDGPDRRPVRSLAREAAEKRPDAIAHRHAMAAAELEIRSSYMRWAPVISGFGRLHAFNYAGFYTNENYVWSLGVLIDWQVYDGGLRDARRHLAESVRTENAVKLSSLGDTIFNDLTMAQQSIETKLRGLESAERRVVLTNKAFEILRIQHTAGVAPQIDLLIAQDALINAEVDASRARFELALAEIAFRKAAGLLPYK